ncbi:hypothetical protein BGX21_004780 [Mortierella sp. AD011]|nr:hypothetical protein BGX21_004780 [Mortierella sp. AD011]
MLPIPTKRLSTKAMTKPLQTNGNEYTDWTSIKPNTPYGHLSVLYETAATGETLELAELSVIEFYLGRKFGLVGSNDWEEQLIRPHTNSSQALFDKLTIATIRAPTEPQPLML